MEDRSQAILELLTRDNKLEVSVLADCLNVSQVTIRKDLDALEQRGIVVREHGCAVLRNRNDVSGRIAYHYEAKLKIARRAAELVSDGDTLMIENGSCCALLAAELAAARRDLTLLTNSAFIAGYIRASANVQVILLGGSYQRDSQVLVGPLVRQCAENFCVDHFFIGTDGYSPRTGFTNRDQLRAQAVRDMALQAEQVIVLTESEKFSRHGAVPLNLKNGVQGVITDKKASGSILAELEAQGILVTQV